MSDDINVHETTVDFADDGGGDDTPERLSIEEDLVAFAETADGDKHDFAEVVGGEEFNEHGVRENRNDEGDLESVDVVFEAMEPGPPDRRNGVRITPSFLQDVASKEYGESDVMDQPPHLLDHNKRDSRSKIGDVREVWFSEQAEKLMLMVRVPNTGADVHEEAISRYTHDPPSWRDGSVGFGREYEAVRNQKGEPELRDATLQEFSTTNFPGGYDDGGLAASFAEAAVEEASEFDDAAEDAPSDGDAAENSAIGHETLTF